MARKVRVMILDDHQSAVDGYLYRLSNVTGIEVIATLRFGEELRPSLEKCPVDVLVLDFSLPTSSINPSLYLTRSETPKLLELSPNLDILMI